MSSLGGQGHEGAPLSPTVHMTPSSVLLHIKSPLRVLLDGYTVRWNFQLEERSSCTSRGTSCARLVYA